MKQGCQSSDQVAQAYNLDKHYQGGDATKKYCNSLILCLNCSLLKQTENTFQLQDSLKGFPYYFSSGIDYVEAIYEFR